MNAAELKLLQSFVTTHDEHLGAGRIAGWKILHDAEQWLVEVLQPGGGTVYCGKGPTLGAAIAALVYGLENSDLVTCEVFDA